MSEWVFVHFYRNHFVRAEPRTRRRPQHQHNLQRRSRGEWLSRCVEPATGRRSMAKWKVIIWILLYSSGHVKIGVISSVELRVVERGSRSLDDFGKPVKPRQCYCAIIQFELLTKSIELQSSDLGLYCQLATVCVQRPGSISWIVFEIYDCFANGWPSGQLKDVGCIRE